MRHDASLSCFGAYLFRSDILTLGIDSIQLPAKCIVQQHMFQQDAYHPTHGGVSLNNLG